MGVEIRRLQTAVHGRYLLRRPRKGPALAALIGFHGYGESAESLLAALEPIPGSDRLLLASVQALHPFYRGRTDEVVASWMTRQDRELAIADNLAYVNRVLAEVQRESGKAPLVYAGFSQGVAMAYRAAAGGPAGRGLIALAGDVPPELAGQDLAGFPAVLVGRGRDDLWYDEEKLARDLELLQSKGVEVRVCRFEGGHEWSAEFRAAAGDFLRQALDL